MVSPTEPKTLSLDGPVTVYEVLALRDAFKDALADGEDLRVELEESTKWDLAGLQLLISCVRTAEADGHTMRLAKIPQTCTDAAERAGLTNWLDSVKE